MSKAGKFVKKHPWEAAAGAAALGLGGAGLAGMGPLAGLLGEGAAAAVPEAGAALAGASGLSELAGATGAPLASTPSVTGGLFGGANVKQGLQGMSAANKAMGLLSPQQTPPPPMGMAPTPATPPTNTVLPTLSGVGSAVPPGVSPQDWAMFMKMKQQQ